jgi:hypothetical protein
MRKIISFLVLYLILFSIAITPVFAQSDKILHRNITHPVSFSDLGIYGSIEFNGSSKKKLLLEYSKVLNIARALGESISIDISLNKDRYCITDFRRPGQEWTRLTAGHLVMLISQEISKDDFDNSFTYVDLLVKDKNSSDYYPVKMVKVSTLIDFLTAK